MDLVYVIQLFVDEFVTLVPNWFECLEDGGHEARICFVVPAVMTVCSSMGRILNSKISLEAGQKGAKQEITVDLKLNFVW
jgi:hypothetical protein|tara:strand:+ start:910 stop:1149 length:240 start_codon:yes stop_codon:yes gene_type:complete